MRDMIGYGILAPPNLLIILCLVGSISALVWQQRMAIVIASAASFGLFVLATPAFSSCLLVWLEADIPANVDFSAAQAIVIPCADFRSGHGGADDGPGPQSVQRLMLAADAYNRFHLPILVTGGPAPQLRTTCARLLKSTIERYFAVPVSWVEDRSQTTFENAANSAELLQKMNIHTVIVVTQARDTPRAIWSFERVGVRALPWPAPRATREIDQIADVLPNPESLEETYYALHEMIGALYYRLKY